MTPHAADYYAGAFILALVVICCLVSVRYVRDLDRRAEERRAAHDAEDFRAELAAQYGPRLAYPLPGPDASDAEFDAWWHSIARDDHEPTPIYGALAAEVLRSELDDEEAIERWLSA